MQTVRSWINVAVTTGLSHTIMYFDASVSGGVDDRNTN